MVPNLRRLSEAEADGVFEIHDLKNDPGETRNLYDELGPRGPSLMSKLDAFFETPRESAPGSRSPNGELSDRVRSRRHAALQPRVTDPGQRCLTEEFSFST